MGRTKKKKKGKIDRISVQNGRTNDTRRVETGGADRPKTHCTGGSSDSRGK